MRILILGSVALPIPPPRQGGTERIAYYQATGLAARGHDVTLVAPLGSAKGAYRLVEIGAGDTGNPKLDEGVESSRNLRKEAVYLSQVSRWLLAHCDEYDVVINNMRAGESIFLPIVSTLGKTMINIMHLPIFPELAETFRIYKSPVVTISNAQRKEFPDLRYLATVYNCVELDTYTYNPSPEGYLLMMGSVTPHKNQAAGIRVAKALGKQLIIAGKIGNQIYNDAEIAPHVDGKMVIYHGELPMDEKVRLYQHAAGFLMPIVWEEPFGLVMIEAMACGTPVIAFNRGAIPEVVVDGKTGFVVQDEMGMIEAVKKLDQIDRAACRTHVEEHFSIESMVTALEQALKQL